MCAGGRATPSTTPHSGSVAPSRSGRRDNPSSSIGFQRGCVGDELVRLRTDAGSWSRHPRAGDLQASRLARRSLPQVARVSRVESAFTVPEELVSQSIGLPSGERRLLQPRESAEPPNAGAVEWGPIAPSWSLLRRSGVAPRTRARRCGAPRPARARGADRDGPGVCYVLPQAHGAARRDRNATRQGLIRRHLATRP